MEEEDDDNNYMLNNENGFKTRTDLSEAIRPSEEGIIESVMLTTNRAGYTICKVKCVAQ